MNRKLILKLTMLLLLTASFASAPSAYAAGVVARVGSTPHGKIVVDGKGMSAYFFDLDKANSGVSACSAECSANWPPILSSTAKPHVSGIKGAVGSILLKSGGHQVTINGRPIYTFAFDTAPGDVKGQGAQGVWHVISPTGKEIKVLTLASNPSSSPTKASVYGRSNY